MPLVLMKTIESIYGFKKSPISPPMRQWVRIVDTAEMRARQNQGTVHTAQREGTCNANDGEKGGGERKSAGGIHLCWIWTEGVGSKVNIGWPGRVVYAARCVC